MHCTFSPRVRKTPKDESQFPGLDGDGMLESSFFSFVLLVGSNLSFVLSGNRRQQKSSSSLANIPIWGRSGLIGWLLVSSALGFVLLTILGDHVLSWTNCVQVRFGSNLVDYSELIEGPQTEALKTLDTMLDEVVKRWGIFLSHGCDRSWRIWALRVFLTWVY